MYHWYAFGYDCVLSVLGWILCKKLIAEFIPIFISRGMFGKDLCKASGEKVAEPMGVVIATTYLIVMFLFIPAPFYGWMNGDDPVFPYSKFVEFLSGLTSICCMILLGFADDVLDLKWRHKLFLPTIGSLPLLMVYYVNCNSTTIALPKIFSYFFHTDLNIGFFYYVYIGMVAVFCTNAINILAGVNGLEAGQSLVVAVSIIFFNFFQLYRLESQAWYHLLSLYFLVPYAAVTLALLHFNWYPAKVFVGDTFCYFSGMTFAVVGILGHFSKTLLLFFIPQIFNFLFSVPQLFHMVPCPRHRLPRYNVESGKLEMSTFRLKKSDLKTTGKLCVWFFKLVKLLSVKELEIDGDLYLEMNNFTLINLVLKIRGPLPEFQLAAILLYIQIACSFLAFFIRFFMAGLIYDAVH